MKAKHTWILIADGGRARVLRHEGLNRGLTQVAGATWEIELPANREILSDRPTRTVDSQGSSRHAVEPKTDPHRELKRRFAAELAGYLHEHLRKETYDRLVLVAPPAMLGDLRAEMSDKVRAHVALEVAKDLTKTPNSEIIGHLEGLIGL